MHDEGLKVGLMSQGSHLPSDRAWPDPMKTLSGNVTPAAHRWTLLPVACQRLILLINPIIFCEWHNYIAQQFVCANSIDLFNVNI